MADPALLAEAYKRGLLPPDKKAAYEEAMKRGLVSGARPNEVAASVDRLKADAADAYGAPRLGDTARYKPPALPQNALVTDKIGRWFGDTFGDQNMTVGGARRVEAADRMGSNVLDLPASAVRQYVNKPLSALTGIPEDILGAVEMTGAMVAGARPVSPRNALAQRAAPKPRPAPKPTAAKPMTLDQVRAAKQAAYKNVEQSGVAYTPEAFKALSDDIVNSTRADNISDIRHQKAASMVADIDKMAKAGHAPTLTELDQLRQVVRRDVANAKDDAEAHFGELLIDRIDNFIENAPATATRSGAASDASALITQARQLHQRQRKMEAVQDAVDKAVRRAGSTGAGGNVDNAIRQNIRAVLEKGRGWTPDEKAALESIIVGDAGQNALRQVGKLSPQGNGLMQAGHLMALGPTGGLSAVGAVAGAASKVAADTITRQKVKRFLNLVADGGALPAKPKPARAPHQPKATTPQKSNSSLPIKRGHDRTKVGGR